MPDTPETSESAPGTEIELEVGAPESTQAEDTAPEGSELGDPARAKLQAKLTLLTAQLEESFARARDTQGKLKDEHERLLRTAAEFENFKRRALKEKDDLAKFGTERLLKEFLPVADNLERAMDHAEQHDPKHVIEGVRLVQKMLDQALAKHGVTGFSAVGKPFDPALHEALMQQESDLPSGHVVSEMAKGYKLHDRLLRPAAVVVAKPRAQAAPEVGEPGSVSDNGGEGGSTNGDLASSSKSGNGPN